MMDFMDEILVCWCDWSVPNNSTMAVSMVRKHRQLHQQRQHRRRILSQWMQLSVPVVICLFALYSFQTVPRLWTKSNDDIVVWNNNHDCVENLWKDSKLVTLFESTKVRNDPESWKESLHCWFQQHHTAHVDAMWIAGSTAAAGYGNAKSQSYGEIVRQRVSSVRIDAMRDSTEFPLAWCHQRNNKKELVVYDFQDDRHTFDMDRLRAFCNIVQPAILVVRMDVRSHTNGREILDYLQSLEIIVYVLDVSHVGGEMGVPNTADALHAHHLTVSQHERIADLLHVLFLYHYHQSAARDDDEDTAVATDWYCATGFVTAETSGRTVGRLQFVNASEISLANVLVDCCGNELNSVLLPHNDIHDDWVWDARHEAEIRRALPFDRHGHDDWKLGVSGTPRSGELSIRLPQDITKVRVCGDCEGMRIASASLHTVGYGCVDVLPPLATFGISVAHGTCFISHIMWQRSVS